VIDSTGGLDALIEEAGNLAGVSLSARQVDQLVAYWSVLGRWNAKVNLTSLPLVHPTREAVRRLIWEPLFASLLDVGEPRAWFDLGSGCGSPAIPMKVARPAIPLSMVESRSRKVAFLREAVRAADLRGAEVINCRIENVSKAVGTGSIDLVTLRAVKLTRQIVGSMATLVRPGGKLILFGCPDRTSLDPSFEELMSTSGISLLTRRSVPRA